MPNRRNYNLTEAGKDKVTENLPVENRFKTVHGLYAYMKTNIYPTKNCPVHQAGLCPACTEDDQYCKAVDEIKREITENLSRLDYLKGITGQILIHEFAQDVAYLFIIDRWTSYASVVKTTGKDIDLQAVHKRRWTIAESMRRLAESMSITPKQMIELGLQVEQFKDYAKRAQELKNKDDNG